MPGSGNDEPLNLIGQKYHKMRDSFLTENGIGPTQFYNRFHNPEDKDAQIVALRDLHRQMDLAVLASYGWQDLDLAHDFHEMPYLPVNDRCRFTLSEHARLAVLRRLSELNHERYSEEVEAGLHKIAKKAASGRKRTSRDVGDLFNADTADTETVDD